jgi:hypothetical protein
MPVIYRLDERDCLIAMNRKWKDFAIGNGAPELAEDRLLGESLWRFVAGVEVAQIYREVFRKAREQSVQIVFPFRCDSQELRRDMLMKVLPRSDGHLEIQCITRSILRNTSRLDFAASRGSTAELLTVCSWCKDALLNREWVPLEQAIKELDLLGSMAAPQTTFSICRDCRDKVARQ